MVKNNKGRAFTVASIAPGRTQVPRSTTIAIAGTSALQTVTDPVHVEVLKALQIGNRRAIKDVDRRLNRTPKTVDCRLKRLTQIKLIRGIESPSNSQEGD